MATPTQNVTPVDLDRLVRRLKSKAAREWRAIWRRYPHHKRTDEERQIVHDEQIRINGYTQALDDILANVLVEPSGQTPRSDNSPTIETP